MSGWVGGWVAGTFAGKTGPRFSQEPLECTGGEYGVPGRKQKDAAPTPFWSPCGKFKVHTLCKTMLGPFLVGNSLAHLAGMAQLDSPMNLGTKVNWYGRPDAKPSHRNLQHSTCLLRGRPVRLVRLARPDGRSAKAASGPRPASDHGPPDFRELSRNLGELQYLTDLILAAIPHINHHLGVIHPVKSEKKKRGH